MTNHALSHAFHNTADMLVHEQQKPLLEALEYIRYGRMVLVTPEGKELRFNGIEAGPDAHLQIYDWDVLDDLTARGEIGFVEAYKDGRWESINLPALLTFGLMNSQSLERFFHGHLLHVLRIRLRNWWHGNTRRNSKRNVVAHYDLGNEFYALWLDDSMTYSGALFEGEPDRSLEYAQAAKYNRILRKLAPKPGQHILDIGCGWGGFAEIAARQGYKVTGVTLSESQVNYARERLQLAELNHLASIELMDYRDIKGTFDHVVSIGMFEHVGENHWSTYFETIKRRLKPGGKAMVQSITLDDHLFESLHDYSGFMEQLIFPGSMLPSKSRFREVANRAGLECRETFAFGQDYARTVTEWLKRFEKHQTQIWALGYDEQFLRLWRFYLASCIASFTSRRTDVMQAELVPVYY